MKKRTKIMIRALVLALFLSGLSGCHKKVDPEVWVETFGQIETVETMEDGTYAFALVYDATGSTAVSTEGQPIAGPITQYYFKKPNKPLAGQQVKMRYRRDEPVVFELLEAIRYVSD